MSDGIDTDALRKLYSDENAASAFLDHCAARQRNQTETTVDRALANLNSNGHGLSRSEVVRVLKSLRDLGCGDFITGRRGWPSRFIWATEMIAVGKVAAGEDQEIEYLEEETEDESIGNEDLVHTYHLRLDYQVEIQLPSDLRPDESERLAKFISSLPFQFDS